MHDRQAHLRTRDYLPIDRVDSGPIMRVPDWHWLSGRVASFTFFQWLLWLTVSAGACAIWLAPLPPSVDFPQHAGQIALLRDIWLGKSPWAGEMRLNLFSPYVLPYLFAAPLSLIMPAAAALKVLLTAGYLLFVYSCVALSRQMGSDHRLHWFFVPTYFGYSWKWGFFPFLIAAPFGVLLVLLACRYSERPRFKTGVWIVVWGALLFFCHGLILVMAIAVGTAFLLFQRRRLRERLLLAWPYVLLALLVLAVVLFSPVEYSASSLSVRPVWRLSFGQLGGSIFIASWGTSDDVAFVAFDFVVLLALVLLGPSINRGSARALVPFIFVLLIVVAAPLEVLKAALIQSRFALFLLPFLALMFRTRENRPLSMFRNFAGQTMLCLGCWIFLGFFAHRQLAFAAESRDFDAILADLEPGHRALSMCFNRISSAAVNENAYMHFALRYQAEKRGLVDVNFASNPQSVVKFAEGHLPRAIPDFNWYPEEFDWRTFEANQYRYIIIRHLELAPRNLFAGNQCQLRVVRSSGAWTAFESLNCQE
jgi:hypothetical protein